MNDAVAMRLEAVKAEVLGSDDGAGSVPASAGVAGVLPGWTDWDTEGGRQ